ncbi:hypothetical protein D4764_06G0007500 [Takifugu flavidus]|uniref:Uncharacterized protein n=1 Tax=Takifugu flavidus TaxID=433684 RepID=A0A5C6N0G7_9TELE|nr:hypothetical protein D4764_06G0007500 [Takifugu flavidus]
MESPVGTLSSIRPRHREATLSLDRKNSNVKLESLGASKKPAPSSPSLTLSNSSIEECPTPLKDLGSRANAMRGANFHNRGSDRQGPCLGPPPNPHCTGPFMLLLWVVGPLGTGVST